MKRVGTDGCVFITSLPFSIPLTSSPFHFSLSPFDLFFPEPQLIVRLSGGDLLLQQAEEFSLGVADHEVHGFQAVSRLDEVVRRGVRHHEFLRGMKPGGEAEIHKAALLHEGLDLCGGARMRLADAGRLAQRLGGGDGDGMAAAQADDAEVIAENFVHQGETLQVIRGRGGEVFPTGLGAGIVAGHLAEVIVLGHLVDAAVASLPKMMLRAAWQGAGVRGRLPIRGQAIFFGVMREALLLPLKHDVPGQRGFMRVGRRVASHMGEGGFEVKARW